MEPQEVIGVLLPLTAICSYINYKFIKLPKSIGITLVALALTVLVTIVGALGVEVELFAQQLVDSIGFNETFLHGMLSFLLFAGALHINTKDLAKYKIHVAIFATVSVIISTAIIGYTTYWITQALGLGLPLYFCFVFGALISPTDAIAVLEVLKTAKIPKPLEMKIVGEALFNDGMGIVLFFVAIRLAYGLDQSFNLEHAALYFLREGGGGIVCGAIVGWVTAFLLRNIDDYELAILLTLAIVTGGYAFATSVLDVSGPIFMVTAGIIIGSLYRKGKMSDLSADKVSDFWDLIDRIFNAILFVLIGLEFVRLEFDTKLILASGMIILLTIVARWLSILVPMLCFTRFKSFDSKLLNIMTWSGLRGGISIALALSITGKHHNTIVSITYFVVLFSIVVQGLTLKPMIKTLQGLRKN